MARTTLLARSRAAWEALRGRALVINQSTAYEAASQARRLLTWRPPTLSPNGIIPSLGTLRDRSRQAVRDDGYAKGVIDELVRNVIGWGIKPLSQAPDPAIRKRMHTLWSFWCEETGFYAQQALAVRGWFESGESFGRLRLRLPEDGLIVPLQLEILEPELCPYSHNSITSTGARIRAGIEFDRLGRPSAFYFHPSRPDLEGDFDSSQLVPVPASSVLHLFEELRPGQLRGVPQLTQALIKLRDLDKFDDATLLRQQIANLFAMFIKRPEADSETTAVHPLTGLAVGTGETPSTVGLEPGIAQELAPGEDVTFSDPPGVDTSYEAFTRQQLRAICVASGVPYEVLTGDMASVNDRTARVILNKFKRGVQVWQFNVVVTKFLQPTWNAWLQRAYLAGVLDLPREYLTDPRPWQAAKWMPQRWQYIHPVQDVEADKELVRAGFSTRAAVVSEYGEDVEQIDLEQAADNQRADDLGLVYTSDGRVPSSGKAAAAAPAEPDPSATPPVPAEPYNQAPLVIRVDSARSVDREIVWDKGRPVAVRERPVAESV